MRVLPAVFAILVGALPAWAQDAETLRRFERTLEKIREGRYETTNGLTLAEHARLDYGVYTTFSGLALDDEAGNTRVQRQLDSRLWLRGRFEGHLFYGRLRLRYRDYNTGDSFDGRGDELVDPVGDRYWYRFDWRADQRTEEGRDTSWNWWTQIGRQYVHWASGLTLSDTLYAARAGAEWPRLRVEAFWAMTPSSSFIDFDASRPGFTTDTDREFWGALAEFRAGANHRPYVFVLGQEDENDAVFPGPTFFGYDSVYVGCGVTGQFSGEMLYRFELIHEFGSSASDIFGVFPQTVDDISAWAGHFELVYTPRGRRERDGLRIEIEILFGSGDSDRTHASQTVGGNLSGTDDESFNAFGYARTGLALAPELANLLALRVGASMFPLRGKGAFHNLRVAIDAFLFTKTDDDAPVSVLTVAGESYVGMEFDLVLEWQVFSDVSVDLRYGVFIPGGAIADSDLRHFAYAGVSYGF